MTATRPRETSEQEEDDAEPAPRFRLLRLADVEKLPDPTYLVHGVLPERATVMLYGAPGDGKTFVAVDLALAIATGRATWFGRAVKQGRVVYLLAEGLAGLKRRVRAWSHTHDDAPAGQIQFIGEPVQLLQLGDVAELTLAIDAFSSKPPALIVLDTLSRCMPGGDENSVQDSSLVVRSMDYLTRYYGATVLLIHHTQRAGDLERGSGNWRASVDVMLHVKNDDAVRELRTTKVRDGAPLEGLRFVLRPTLESCIIATPDPADDDRMTASQREALEVIGKLSVGENAVTANAWLKTSGLQDRTFYNCSSKLQELGFVRKTGKGYVLTPVGSTQLQLQRNCKAAANA